MSNFDWQHPTVLRLIARYEQLQRKATPQDAEQSRVVREVAEYYAANYDGSFEFMVKMHGIMSNFNKLSVGQASGVINCLMAEYRHERAQDKADSLAYAKDYSDSTAIQQHYKEFVYPTAELPNLPAEIATNKAAELAQQGSAPVKPIAPVSIRELPIKGTCSLCGVDSSVSYDTSLTPSCTDKAACEARRNTPVVPACKSGTYTVILNEKGEYRTIKLSDVPSERCVNGIPQGAQYIGYLSGSDNEKDYTPCGYVFGTQLRIKAQYRNNALLVKALTVLLSAGRETQIDMGHAYAIESGNCFLCGRKLTVPASVARGLGPICAEKY